MIACIEGVDSCGKATLVEALRQHFTARGSFKTLIQSFPNYNSETGKIIRAILTGQAHVGLLVSDGMADPNYVQSMILQSLMTINRFEQPIADYGIRGDCSHELMILDRYWLSGLVYGVATGLDHDWLVGIHAGLPKPDLTLVLDCPIEETFRRRPERRDQYERDRPLLDRVRSLYLQAVDNISIVRLDASKEPQYVLSDALKAIRDTTVSIPSSIRVAC